jgi:hypothetical protein
MKKITPTNEEIKQIKTMFVDEFKGLREISKKFNWSTFTVSRILKENGVLIKGGGRKFLGGKKIADKKYRQKNKEKLDNYVKDWYEQNKEHRKQYLKEYREKNIDKIRETKRNYERTRKAKDPIYKLINNFRTAI